MPTPGKLFSVACRMLGNPSDAEDLLQEIFLSAHRKLDGFRGDAALGTWLYRLATNQCLDHLRSRAARTNQLTDVLDDEPALYEAGGGGLAEQTVTKMDLERALAQLPRAAGRRSCCTTSRAWNTARWPTRSGSPKAPRSRRCTRQGCGCVRCSARAAAQRSTSHTRST